MEPAGEQPTGRAQREVPHEASLEQQHPQQQAEQPKEPPVGLGLWRCKRGAARLTRDWMALRYALQDPFTRGAASVLALISATVVVLWARWRHPDNALGAAFAPPAAYLTATLFLYSGWPTHPTPVDVILSFCYASLPLTAVMLVLLAFFPKAALAEAQQRLEAEPPRAHRLWGPVLLVLVSIAFYSVVLFTFTCAVGPVAGLGWLAAHCCGIHMVQQNEAWFAGGCAVAAGAAGLRVVVLLVRKDQRYLSSLQGKEPAMRDVEVPLLDGAGGAPNGAFIGPAGTQENQ